MTDETRSFLRRDADKCLALRVPQMSVGPAVVLDLLDDLDAAERRAGNGLTGEERAEAVEVLRDAALSAKQDEREARQRAAFPRYPQAANLESAAKNAARAARLDAIAAKLEGAVTG